MKLSHFNFELPEELLAEYPAEHRDESRLMVLNRKDQTIEHKTFKDVINYFDEGDVLMLNNTSILAPVFSLLPYILAGKTFVLFNIKTSPSSK